MESPPRSIDEPFGRQPLPTVITITGGKDIDRAEMARMLWLYLSTRIDTVERSHRLFEEVIRCYPRAVND